MVKRTDIKKINLLIKKKKIKLILGVMEKRVVYGKIHVMILLDFIVELQVLLVLVQRI